MPWLESGQVDDVKKEMARGSLLLTVSGCADDNQAALRGVSVMFEIQTEARGRPQTRREHSLIDGNAVDRDFLEFIGWSPSAVGVDVPARAGTMIAKASPMAAIDKRSTWFRRP